MGTSGNIKLPTSISPCLRLFIESLFNEGNVECEASLHQTQGFQSSLSQATNKGERPKIFSEEVRAGFRSLPSGMAIRFDSGQG